MKTKVRFVINLVEWSLLPVNWDMSSMDLGIEHRRYYFLCFRLEIYKTRLT
jgi:uncharacterized protein YijF (DUF1287 family)